MSFNKELINSILQNKKLQKSSEKVYTDEPLIFTASQMKNYTPPEYLEMKNLTGSFYCSSAEIFYKQAKFMENFRESFDYHGEFLRYFPTYRDMNNLQLRGYFSWRTDVRDGKIEKTCISFVFVYIYELINLIGVSNATEAFEKLKAFSETYYEIDTRIKIYTDLWLKDIVVYHGLNPSLLSGHPDLKYDDALITLKDYESREPDAVLDALDIFSSYKIKNSAFYKKYPQDTAKTVYLVFDMLSEHYRKNSKGDVFTALFGKYYKNEYFMFRSAVFYEEKNHPDCIYEINNIYKYICKRNIWSCERFFCQKDKAGKLGAILKNTDYFLRQSFNYKSSLKSADCSDIFIKTIEKAIALYLKKKKENEKPKIEIDVSKLQNIRDVSLITRDKLIVDEENPEEEPVIIETQVTETPDTEESTLTPLQLIIIDLLLQNKDCETVARNNGMILSVITDEINETLFDLFADTVIIFDGDKPYIIDDYKDELKGMIKG